MNRLFRLSPLIAITALSACETIQGAGRDMQTAGQAIQQQSYNSQTQMGQTPATAPVTGYATPMPPAPGAPSSY